MSAEAPSSFLSAHPSLEVLHMDINIHSGPAAAQLVLTDGALPRLREIKASREVINAILACPSKEKRPLEVIKGFKLSGYNNSACEGGPSSSASHQSISDATFLSNLGHYGSSIRKIELVGWHDMEDIRKLASCIPSLQYLDVGRRLGGAAAQRVNEHYQSSNVNIKVQGVATNMVEWVEVMSTMPELTAMYGIKFFYEVSSAAMGTSSISSFAPSVATVGSIANTSWPGTDSLVQGPSSSSSLRPITPVSSQAKNQVHMSMMERSRMRKNDEIAGVLAWKCPKLKRVDHWEEGTGKVIVLLRDRDREHGHGHDEGGKEREAKARWEVRRFRASC